MRQWEPAEVSTFNYDAEGRLLSVVTLREPEFDADDVALLIASRRDANAPRNHLGIRLSDATNPENAGAFIAGAPTADPDAPFGPVTDYSIATLQRFKDGFYKQFPDDKHDPSHLWPVRLRD